MSMYFDEKGNKNAPTIVFIHGGGVPGWMWKKQWEAFDDFHCLIPDLPDHGRSVDEGPISIEDGAERIAGLIREYANGSHAHVVGHSLGGKIVVQLLSTHPELIDSAVAASAMFRPLPLFNLFLNMPIYRLTVWMMKSKTLRDYQARQLGFIDDYCRENCMRNNAALTPEMLDRVYTQLNKHLFLPEGLGGVNVPTLVIAGSKEPEAMRQSVADVAHALPNAKGCLVKGGQHHFPWVMNEVFNDAVRAWITGKEISNPMILTVK